MSDRSNAITISQFINHIEEYDIFGFDVSVKPDGSCNVFMYGHICADYKSIFDGLEVIREWAINLYKSSQKEYSDIINDIDSGEIDYDEFFTKEYVDNMRKNLKECPTWIKNCEEGSLPFRCSNCLHVIWTKTVDIIDLDNIESYCHNCECLMQLKTD